MYLQKSLTICGDFIERPTPYLNMLYERYVEGTYVRDFDPSKMNGYNMANYLDSFVRVTNDKYKQRRAKVLEEVANLSKPSLIKMLSSAENRIER